MVITSRWRKSLRDLWLNKARTLLVVLAISIGIFGLGVVVNAYSILMREMDENYLRTNPASVTLWTDPIDDDFVQAVRDLPEIGDAEVRRKVVGRIQVGPDEWKNIWLFVIDDFDDVRVSTFMPEEGAWPPSDGEILLERVALSVAKAEIGVNFKGVVDRIKYNPDYLMDALKKADVEEAKLTFEQSNTPGKFSLGEGFTYVVMPINV